VLAGLAMQRDSISCASSGAHFRSTIEKELIAFECLIMSLSTARTNFEISDKTDDVLGAELGYPAVPIEGEVVVLESFGGAQGTRTFRNWCLGTSRRLIGRSSRGVGISDLHWFNPYIRKGLIEVIEAGIGAEILL